jgi:DNA primase catalytic subunit
MNRQQVVAYYSRPEILTQMTKNSAGREFIGAFAGGGYDSRPNIIQYPNDILQMAKKGVTSFHMSVERWKNPMQLSLDREKHEKFRTGWDLIIDIDSKLGLDEAKIATKMICNLLEKYGIKKYGLKFSGRRGFHICLPWEAFPEEIDFLPSKDQYPRLPRIIARFIRKKISKELMKDLLKRKSAKEMLNILETPPEKLSPFYFVNVEKDWGSRHLFRAPYSLNEKTWLVSLPIKIKEIDSFSLSDALPEKVKAEKEFFVYENNSAMDLITDVMDWHAFHKKIKEEKKQKPKIVWDRKITEDLFPPCIKHILQGISDGRKRSVFTLVNFLRMMNWKWEEIEDKIFEWNNKNTPPLPRSVVLSQLRWSQNNVRTTANCDSSLFYIDEGFCRPDSVCKGGTDKITVKNPVNYPFRMMRERKFIRKTIQYTCSDCKRNFSTMQGLNIHRSRSHGIYEMV